MNDTEKDFVDSLKALMIRYNVELTQDFCDEPHEFCFFSKENGILVSVEQIFLNVS